MKRKIIILLTLIFLFLFSCSKHEKKPEPVPTLKDVLAINVQTGDRFVLISWILPDDPNISKIMVRRKEGYPVAGITDGAEIYFSDLTTSVYDNEVSNGVLYYYKIFTSDGKHFSKGVSVQAVPQIPPDLTPPGEVYNVSVTEGENYVRIVWENPADPDFKGVVVVKREDSCPQSYEDGEILYDGFLTGFTDRDVKNFHRYCYGLFTYDESGNYSSGVLVWAEPFDITPPQDVSVFYVSPSTNRVVVSWVNPEDPDFSHIKLFRDEHLIYTSSGTEEIFFDSHVVTGETVSYRISSCDIYENCTRGLTKSVTIPLSPDVVPPSAVKNFTGYPYPPGKGTILEWENPDDPDFAYVEIYVSDNTCPTHENGNLVYIGAATTYTDFLCGGTGCENDRGYCYTAYSLDASQNYSAGVTVWVVPHDSVPPHPVTSFTTSSDEKGYVYLQWINPLDGDFNGVDIYVIDGKCGKNLYMPEELETLVSGHYPVILTGEITSFLDKDPPLPSDRAHLCYAVSSRDTTGNLSPAPATTVTVIDRTPPHPLVSVVAEPLIDGSIYFTWVYPDDPDVVGVKILRRMAETSDDDNFLTCNESGLASIFYPQDSFLDTTLSGANGAYYNYTFCAYDEWQNFSLPYEITVRSYDSQPPSPVSDVTFRADPDGNMVEIYWSLPTDPDLAGVEVVRKTGTYPYSPTDPEGVVLLKGMSSEFLDLSVMSGNVYYYAIYAYDYNGNFSSPVSFEVEVRDVKAPGEVQKVRFHHPVTSDTFKITWLNPDDQDFTGVTVIVNKNDIPLSHTDGELIYRGMGNEIVVSQPVGTLWYYGFYTSDEVPNYSSGVIIPYYRSPITHIIGGSAGEKVNILVHRNKLFFLYYSAMFTRGIVLEERDYNGNLKMRKVIEEFSEPSFLSIAEGGGYMWVLIGLDKAELLKLENGNVIGRLRIGGNWDQGKLSSCGDRVALILNNGTSSYLYLISGDMNYSVREIRGSREFDFVCYNDRIYHVYSDNNFYLDEITDSSIKTLRISAGGYSPSLTVTEYGWRVLYQRINGPFVSLSSHPYDGEVTDVIVSDYFNFPVFVKGDEFTGFYPLEETPSIVYGRFNTDSVTIYPVAASIPSDLDALYWNGVTFVTFQDAWTTSLYLVRLGSTRDIFPLVETNYYTFFDLVTTTSDDFALIEDLRGNRSIISVDHPVEVTSSSSILHLSSDGTNLYILEKDQGLNIVKTDPSFSSPQVINLGVEGDDGKVCVGRKIFVAYTKGSSLYTGVVTGISGNNAYLLSREIGPSYIFDIDCDREKAVISRIFYQSSKIYGAVNLIYPLQETDIVIENLWSTILTAYPPSIYGKISDNLIDIFVNNEGIEWVRVDVSGNQVNGGTYLTELKAADFSESRDLSFVAFRDLTAGDLYLGRYIRGKWYFAPIDTTGDCGSYPEVVIGSSYNLIFYLCGGGVYRAIFQ